MKKTLIIFLFLLCIKQGIAGTSVSLSYINGISKMYQYNTYNLDNALSFKSEQFNKYMWGVLIDIQLYKHLYLSTGLEHKAFMYGASQSMVVSDYTTEKTFLTKVTQGIGRGGDFWSVPIRFAYRQPIFKGIYISPNIGFSYNYSNDRSYTEPLSGSGLGRNDTLVLEFAFTETKHKTINNHLYHLQFGTELGYSRNFFSVYVGVNYSLGLNRFYHSYYDSYERDIYSNLPAQRFSAVVISNGTNLNGYIGVRFQLYPIIKLQKKEK